MSLVVYFDPGTAPTCVPPDRFPSPFARATPHPLARLAAEQLVSQLPSLEEGKMFGVLVVEQPGRLANGRGRLGYLRAFSGMLHGSWFVDGFVPPVFDARARDAMWPAGEAELDAITARIEALDTSRSEELAAIDRRCAIELEELRARHRANREQRQAARIGAAAEQVHALAQASRGDTAEKRRMLERHAAERGPLACTVATIDNERRALEKLRADKSRFYLHALFDTYSIANARGETRSLRELFAPAEPPGGAGDCAAPKLLAHAYREGLRPIALAEIWCGPPPLAGGRHAGVFYPACRGKCGPVLAHMLEGLDAEPAPVFGIAPINSAEPRVVLDAERYVIVDKPAGLLSVPGKSPALRDSVQFRVARRFGEAHLVHRLDLDASGLLLVAKDRETHAALQRLFASRAIDKRYIAILDGEPRADGGVVELALRVDLDDRPRQIYDPIHGDFALTEWRVLDRSNRLTRVELFPRTGRTHQLRVHAAHPLGIGVPIVGDPLYGRASDGEMSRLLLHADRLVFVDPHTQREVKVESKAPF